MKKISLPLLFVCLLPSQLFALNSFDLYRAGKFIFAYFSNLEHRQNRPTSREEWIKRVELQTPQLIKELKSTENNDFDYYEHEPRMHETIETMRGKWKQSWWDHNPVLGDLALAGGIIVVVAALVAITGHDAPPAGGLGGNAPVVNPGNFPGQGQVLGNPPPYQG